jgi:hypothetical protein
MQNLLFPLPANGALTNNYTITPTTILDVRSTEAGATCVCGTAR